jgi:hypothetical protein
MRKATGRWPTTRVAFIWDDCQRAGVSYRSYGEFGKDGGPKNNGQPNPLITSLRGHYCASFTGWDLTVPDTTRFSQWKADFDSLMAAGSLPQLNIIRIGNDHTAGLRRGQPTPFAYVADNDLAVGEFVEYLSKSPIWKESVVIMLEDDAQNGPDHVDAHRSPCLYCREGSSDIISWIIRFIRRRPCCGRSN